jgi:Cu-Zn family superoxide dismutase
LPALLQNTEGTTVAVALVAESDDEITVSVAAVGLAPGEHGIHVHETGICDPTTDPPFSSAGGHYNPTDEEHGDHAGDLGNISAEEDGTALLKETTDEFTLDELIDEDGSAIVIHAEEDENDPEGESFGARIACGVLAEPVAETATEPVVTEAAVTEEVVTEEAATEPVVTEAVATEEPVTEEAATEEVGAVDSDEDGLVDDDEIDVFGTDPALFDSDEDGLGDGDEVNAFETDPLVFDTDGDGVGDGDEVEAETDPLDPASV